MFKWTASKIQKEADFAFLEEGIFLWVINWKLIPPHIALSKNGRYFSVTIKEAQVDKEIQALTRLFEKKQKPVFFVRFNARIQLEERELKEGFQIELSVGRTCLEPVNKVLFGDAEQFGTVADLLAALDASGLIKSVHVPTYTNEDQIGVFEYSKKTVAGFINSKRLENAITK